MILMSDVEGVWDSLSEAEQSRIIQQHEAFEKALRTEDKFVCSFRAAPAVEARTVRRDESGSVRVDAGPFTSGSESLGGLYVIEADSMEEALQWAERCRFIQGANEVRPVFAE